MKISPDPAPKITAGVMGAAAVIAGVAGWNSTLPAVVLPGVGEFQTRAAYENFAIETLDRATLRAGSGAQFSLRDRGQVAAILTREIADRGPITVSGSDLADFAKFLKSAQKK